MKTVFLFSLAAALAATARADFSYTTTNKNGAMPAANQTMHHYLKGQKMMQDSGDSATILDFDAQTITSLNRRDKTYSVTKFGELEALKAGSIDAKADVKETGQRKTINGYNAREVVMTLEMSTPQMPGKMQMEMDLWVSSDVPGAGELKAFYQKNANRFPWSAMGGAGNPSARQAMVDLQRKMASLDGVPVLEVMKMKSAGNDAQAAQMQQGMAQARAQLEQMKKQGGQQAVMAEQALARMGGAAAGSGSLMEVTMESSNFSAASVPDSTFAIPAGYQMKKVTPNQ